METTVISVKLVVLLLRGLLKCKNSLSNWASFVLDVIRGGESS